MLFSQIAIIAPLLLGAIAAPASSDQASHLAKRSQSVHLVNCGSKDSVVVYCPNDSNCDFNPSPSNYCTWDATGLGLWEGGEKSCTFTTGITFQWGIESDAQSKQDYTFVGTGSNGATNFNIYKDNKHPMYNDSFSDDCDSIYYALPQ